MVLKIGLAGERVDPDSAPDHPANLGLQEEKMKKAERGKTERRSEEEEGEASERSSVLSLPPPPFSSLPQHESQTMR